MTVETIDLVVQIPLEEEFQRFLEVFPPKENRTQGVHLTYLVEAPHGAKVVVVLQEKMGRAAALGACRYALGRFAPRLYVCLGIAGGMSGDLKLGDIAYTGTIIDVLDNSKVLDAEDGDGVELDFDPEFYHTSRLLTANVGFIRTMPELASIHEKWKCESLALAKNIFPNGIPLTESSVEENREPKNLNGTIICGAVGQSENYKKRLKGVSRRLLALETESGSVFAECIDRSVNVIAIRGISDYADSEKKKLEKQSKDGVRRLAATNAATYLRAQLECDPFLEFIISDDEPALALSRGAGALSTLPELLKRASEAIDEKLRQLSPHYKAKPVGFRLPPPRIRPILADIEKRQARPVEILKAIEAFGKIVVNVPRTYPDPALPWAIAGYLVSADINERKAIPIVIDGRAISRPRSGLAALSPIELPPDSHALGAELIFIIYNFDFNSKTKTDFLSREIAEIPNARYMFLSDEDQDLSARLEQRKLITTHEFRVCNASFNEITLFFEDAFSLPGREAEVLALEFQKLFRQFQLPSHPSFFAGIASDVLAALLQANRRSELIQLAVDGALSFIVAADTDAIRLSRTTRSGFLRKLVFEQKVNKRSFTQSEIVNFAREISERFDYGINPISFIESFEKNGIIYFDGDRAKVTMPFIEAYLLARELRDLPKCAAEYFDPLRDDFDYLTFDIYAELGTDEAVLQNVMKSIVDALSGLTYDPQHHILLDDKLNPKILGKPARLASLRRRVADARESLESGKSNRGEKITLLEVAERVQENVAHSQEGPADGKEGEARHVGSEEFQKLDALGRAWSVGALMLGSGAESLEGDERLSLTSMMLQLSEALIHQWTKHTSDIDFEDIKIKIKSDEEFRKSFKDIESEDFNSIVDAVVEYMELVSLSDPFDTVSHQLTDVAKNGVIANSLRKIAPDTPIQRVIHAAWLTHIDANSGRRILLDAIDDLPLVKFFRAVLTSWLILRLKWKVPTEAAQRALLDAAEASIRPLNRTIEKGELIRFIQRKDRRKRERELSEDADL